MELYKYFIKLLLISGVLAKYDQTRLPNIYKPQHYELRVLTHLDGPDDLLFEGQVKIHFQVLSESANITLHALNLTINEAQIQLFTQNSNNCINKTELDVANEFYIMHLCEKLLPSESYQLTIPFKGQLNDNKTGYYSSSYNDTQTAEIHYLAVTQFSPTFARLAFPCFDEPHLKSTFQVTLGYHRNYTGFSNTPILKCVAHETLKNFVWCEHEQLFRTSTYLVAYAVHNLSSISSTTSYSKHNVNFRSWLQPKLLEHGNYFANLAPKVLSYLQHLFKFDFPLHKIDQLVVPTHNFNAMENWGLITFRESAFAHNDKQEPQSEKERKASTMAHEYTHQWFGNLVTMKWWNDLWLKEGPSTYFGYLTVDALMPEWTFGERTTGYNLGLFFEKDSLIDTIAISREVQGSKEVQGQFTKYVYEKGALMVRMLHKVLGEEIFLRGIRSYLQRFAYDNVEQADLWQSLQESVDAAKEELNLSAIMNSWTLQRGYPLVRAYRDYETAKVWLNQTSFWLSNGTAEQANSCWWVPLTFVSQTQANFEQTQPEFWLECPKAELTLDVQNKTSSDEWLILNPQVNTIYRVDYDVRNWRMIIKSLNTSENFGGIHVLNRAQLLDDLLALAWTKERSYELALSMLEYLPREQQSLPWQRILDALNKLMELLTDKQAQKVKLYMKQLILPLYERCNKLNSSRIHNESSESTALCRLAYAQACRLGVQDCISQAVRLTSQDNEEQVPVNYRDIVYCASLEQHDVSLFQLLLERFKNSTLESQQRSLAVALGCSRNFTQLQQFLDFLLLETKTSAFYIPTVTAALRQGHATQETGKYILQNAKTLNDKLSVRNIKDLPLTRFLTRLNCAEDLNLKQQLSGLTKFEQPLRSAFELRNINLNWLTHRSEEFLAALDKYV